MFLSRRRVIIACTNCRKRKIRCLTPEEPPENPCERCVKRGLRCEYITVTNQQDSARDKEQPEHASKRSSPSQSPPATSLGFDGARWNGPRPHRAYSAPTYGVRHHPYAQHSRLYNGSGYVHQADDGAYNPFASSVQFQGYMESTPTLPPIAMLDLSPWPVLGYDSGDRAQCGICPPGVCQCQWTRN
ncbi:hypothetical protein B0H16DRAFT_166810 [Mycena metata]|uniref:Zn(2)-C6 fungal-type domain-containing protein n=1 Tax=Mycena metata TaxID=1033252 RepID=A0AAD7JWS8_9AGAR|nr:hypothetical protein B0H16DRAFT_166810 [Mycena metata]